MLAQSLITNKMSIQNYHLSFSRDQEREADYYAINTLNKLNLSTEPLIKFLKILENNSIKNGNEIDYNKFSTHPIYEERFKTLKQENSKESYYKDEITENAFSNIKAKIFGFTENNTKGLDKWLNEKELKYANSIILSKTGKLKQSLKVLNQVYKDDQNIFILETKADILYSFGFTSEASKFYSLVAEKYPNNHYINKRIFDISFDNMNKLELINENIFDKYNYLMKIFINDRILFDKFYQLAILENQVMWINFFEINYNFNKEKKNDSLKEYKLIQDKSNNKNLKKIIELKMKIITNE